MHYFIFFVIVVYSLHVLAKNTQELLAKHEF